MLELSIDVATALWFGMLGSCVGSFLNVVAYRLPLGMSVIWKPSHCPRCQHAIRMRDNVPVFGWLLLRGRCRDCGQPIAARYAVVELSLGLIFFLLAYAELFRGGANLPGGPLSPFAGAIDNVYYPNWPLLSLYAYHATLLSLLLAILLIDRDGHRVPLRLVLIGLAMGILPASIWPWLQPTPASGDFSPIQTVISSPHVVLFYLIATASLGAILGAGVAAMPSRQRKSACNPRNMATALALVGAFLGWRATLTITAGTLGIFLVICGLPLRQQPKQTATLLATLTSVFVFITGWERIVSLAESSITTVLNLGM